MEQRKAVMNRGNMISDTALAKHLVKSAVDRARRIEEDAQRGERRRAQLCKACFYFPRMGGAAITHRRCMSCDHLETYGSTNTDKLCLGCAQEGELCKRCGGDIELREGRRQWPAPKEE